MTGSPYGSAPGGPWQPPPGPPQSPLPPKSPQSRAPLFIGIVVGVIGIAISAISAISLARLSDSGDISEHAPRPAYTEQEIIQAEEAICEAYSKSAKALSEAGGQTSDDPNVKYMLALNTRLAIYANSTYLRQTLIDNPAIPSEIADIFRRMASAYDEILIAQLSGAPAESLIEMNQALDTADAEAAEVCK